MRSWVAWRSANVRGKLYQRSIDCNNAREFASKALVAAPGFARARVLTLAFFEFWSSVTPRTRVISRLVKTLRAESRKLGVAS